MYSIHSAIVYCAVLYYCMEALWHCNVAYGILILCYWAACNAGIVSADVGNAKIIDNVNVAIVCSYCIVLPIMYSMLCNVAIGYTLYSML